MTRSTVDRGDPASFLVDARFGIVRHLIDDPRRGSMPAGQHQWVAHVADTARFGAPPVDRFGFGNATDPSDARAAALGEAVERYCGNLVPRRLRTATWDELHAAGEPAVDPSDLALFAPEQYDSPGFPFEPFTRDTRVAWVPGQDMSSTSDVLVPASLVYLNLRTGPATNPLTYAGIAAGPSVYEAQLAALYEIVERDTTAIWWATDGPTLPIRDGAPVVAAFDDLALEDRSVRLHALANQFGLPVIAAFVEDHRRRLIGFGTACRVDARHAADKALTEAFGLLEVAADLADATSPLWDAYHLGLLPAGLFKPFRADHSYGRSYRPDFRDLSDLPSVAQLYLDPEMQTAPLDRLRQQNGAVSIDDLNGPSDAAPLEDILTRVADAGLRAVTVNLTTDDVAKSGLRVVRVVVPGTYSNSPPAFPYLGGRRLHSVPRSLGWRHEPEPATARCRTPIPLG